jgi:hypothetical protein
MTDAGGGLPAWPEVEAQDLEEVQEIFEREAWGDGLPVIPPTAERVRRALDAVRRDPAESLGVIAPSMLPATVGAVAVNAVAAGCRPAYLPVVLAAVEAVADERFNLRSVQGTADDVAPLIVVNGPVRARVGLNAGPNVFGPGWRANATIGRALRFVLTNIGRAVPGKGDRSTLGHPGKYTYCIAEHEEASPWPPLHVDRGFDREASVVTVFAAQAPHQVVDEVNARPEGILTTMADAMTTMANNNMYRCGESLIVHSPGHAARIAQAGWSKEDVREFLFQTARKPVGVLRRGGEYGDESIRFWPRWVDRKNDGALVPACTQPSDLLVVVAGAEGAPISAYVPGWGFPSCRAVSRSVREPR